MLIILPSIAYLQVHLNQFIHLDDDEYITENPNVYTGLTISNIKWALTTSHSSNWHPLTWLSHMLDCQLFDLKPAGHHIVNLLIHILNTILLFAFLKMMTGATWQSAFAAALFAIHPLNVESVAWAAERKNTLSTLFWMLTMIGYIRYIKKIPGAGILLQ